MEMDDSYMSSDYFLVPCEYDFDDSNNSPFKKLKAEL
jgi:hypothetical protein